jgi:1,4-alpha-glucan branching enzyme
LSHGYLALVLHAHLPHVRHPEYEEFLEEDWLFEAITETYVPLVDVFTGLRNEGVDFRVTMSITPPLCEMLRDGFLGQRYLRRLDKLISLSQREVDRTRVDNAFHEAACMYLEKFKRVRQVYVDSVRGDLLSAFRSLQESGNLEIVTCPATHAFLPNLMTPEGARAQLRVAVSNYRKHFGVKPRGIWLAECAYFEGLEEHLADVGIKYFILDAHGIMYGSPRPKYGTYAPVYCPNGVAAFGRDIESSKQVWSAEEGYPGDSEYREFYRDLGYDGHYDYIRPFLHADGVRRNIGIKYHRITGRVELHEKQPYRPSIAREKAAGHAGNFMFNRQHQVRYLHDLLGRKPIVLSPYDAELFGHWWFEGPDFLEFLFRKIAYDQDDLEVVTPGQYLKKHRTNQVIRPSFSSWGDKGYAEVWINATNDWIYRHLHQAEERMVNLARRHRRPSALRRRALNQAARELMLAQSSDWAFIMTTGTMVSYAEKRTREHIFNFLRLTDEIEKNGIDVGWLEWLESKNNVFPEMDYKVFSP